MGPRAAGGPEPPTLLDVLAEARSRGLLGEAALEDQVAHALGFAQVFEEVAAGDTPRLATAPPLPGPDLLHGSAPARWMDLGSGGGLPGLVLAGYWPTATATLLDAAQRRTEFLAGAVEALGWQDRVQVIRSRAEDAGRGAALRGTFDLVVARSFGPPAVTAECAAPFIRPGGLLIVSEPPTAGSSASPESPSSIPDPGARIPVGSSRWPPDELAALGLEPLAALRPRFGYQVLRQVEPCPERFPRRAGMAAKRPLYRADA